MSPRSRFFTSASSYDAQRIKAVRRKLGLSQSEFADVLNVSLSIVHQWERGTRRPEGGSLRLLEVAERESDALLRTSTQWSLRNET